jgi:hypothetical protein
VVGREAVRAIGDIDLLIPMFGLDLVKLEPVQ